MEVNAISGYSGVRFRGSLQTAEKLSARVIEKRDSNGDNQLNVEELGKGSEIFQKIDSNSDNVVNQAELLTALTKRLEEKNDSSIQITVNINVIKASLGSLLANVLSQSDSDTLTGLTTENNIAVNDNQINSNVNERYINALITSGLDVGGLFNSTGILSINSDSSNSTPLFTTNQNDTSQLLLDLLIEELNTPRQDALAILNALQSESFQTVA